MVLRPGGPYRHGVPTPTPPEPDDCAPVPSRRTEWLVIAAVMAAVAVQVGLSLWGILAGPDLPRGWVVVVDVAVGIASCLLVPVLYRSPVAAAVVAAALAVGSTTAIPLSTIATVRVARSRPPATAVLVAGLGVLGHALRAAWRAGDWAGDGSDLGWWVVAVVVVQMGLYGWGAQTRAKDQQIAVLRERARVAEADQARRLAGARRAERARIAREMHDVLAHRLSMVATFAGALEFREDADPAQRHRAAGVVREHAHQALQDLREVIWVLRDDEQQTDDPEVRRRPQPAGADLPTLVEESRAVGVEVTIDGEPDDLPDVVGRTVHRVVQEALTNARKHAPGAPVTVSFDQDADGCCVTVGNPLPADPGTAVPGAGAGLIGLAERVDLAHGTLTSGPDGDRFVVSAWLPLASGDPRAAAHR